MPRFATIRIDVLALGGLLAGGCASLGDDAVPSCPRCGDPVTAVGADGLGHVTPRLRLRDVPGPADIALGFGPWTLTRTPDTGAAPAR